RPVSIATPEATAIAFALKGVTTPGPMTHDLMRDMLAALAASVKRVVITELRSATYYAELQLRMGEQSPTVSSRPSDAIALAARLGTSLYVADDLLDAEGVVLQTEDADEEPSNPEELVGEFRQFLQNIRPEDFSS